MTGERLLSQADNEQSKQTGQEYIDSILLNASPQELLQSAIPSDTACG